MNIQSQKEKIKQGIDAIEDEIYLAAIDNLVNDALHNNLQPSKKIISIEEYIQSALKSEDDIAAGRVKSIETVIKESKNWHK